MKPGLTPDQIRTKVAQLAAEKGQPLSTLSRVLKRSDGYMHRYLRHGVPNTLPEADRGRLARFLGIPEPELGAPVTVSPRRRRRWST